MDLQELYANFRELILNPDPNTVSNRQLDRHLSSALEWLAVRLKYGIETEPNMLLVADQREYPFPRDLASFVWVEYNSQRLIPSSTYRWDREGIDWQNNASGVPVEYSVVQGDRHVTLLPPPSAAAVAANPAMTIRYISASPGMDPSGTPQLGDLDQQLLLYRAAIRYLGSHITAENMQDHQLKMAAYKAEIDELLPFAQRRAAFPQEDDFGHFQVQTDRLRGSR